MEEQNLLILFEIIAFATAVFLGIHYLSSNQKNNKFLGWFLVLGFLPDLILYIFYFINKHESEIVFLNTSFLYIPFLFFYAQNITSQFSKKSWRLLFPAFLITILHCIFQFEQSNIYFVLEHILSYLFSIYICYLILKTIHTHQKNIAQYFSSLEEKTLNWLRILSIILIAFNLLWLIEDFISIFTPWEFYFPEISAFATIITIYWIGFSSLKQATIFSNNIISDEESEEKEEKELSKIEKETFQILERIMQTDALYKNENLNLSDLGIHLKTNDKLLSKIINTATKDNFYNYINSYRIRFFKQLLNEKQNTHLTLFGLAQECGFKTKSTFYTAFKKVEGCTPSEWLQKNKSE
jgi:AraC-like DNA-binding protein